MLKLVALVAVGVKLKSVPTVALVAGVPEIVGGGRATVMEKDGSEAVLLTFTALMIMLLNVPILALVGVPERVPVVVLKVAHEGIFAMLKLEALVAVGVKE
jgi:hypothetical protein